MSGSERGRTEGRLQTNLLDRRATAVDDRGRRCYGRVTSLFLRWTTLDDHAAVETLHAAVEMVTGEIVVVPVEAPGRLTLEPTPWDDAPEPKQRYEKTHPLLGGV